MTILSKILTLWAALFLTVAPVPRCATLLAVYGFATSLFSGAEAKGDSMACHHPKTGESLVQEDHWVKPNSEASCRCLLEDFLKVRLLTEDIKPIFRPLGLVRSLAKNSYVSNLHLDLSNSQELRPPIT